MAEMDAGPFSLMSLEDELTCSICLSPFECPVTIPCGHNFCQDCLLATWKDSYSCPQCRTLFPSRPDLKKNTVLSTVVETFNLRTSKSATGPPAKEKEECGVGEQEAIRCDTCMQAEATHTCLTCMASFCEEHLRPHRDNPTFRLHQLSQPIGDLSERICPDHHKLMELFCSQHGRPICSLCLQQVHKGCSFTSPEEQRNIIESDLRNKMDLLDGKITKNENVILQIEVMQNKLKDSATNRKTALAAEYRHMRDMLSRDEHEAVNSVDRELEGGQTKLKGLAKKFSENLVSMSKAKEEIHSLLSQCHTQSFLQASFTLPQAATFEPFTPRINIDSKKVTATQAFTALLKEHLTEILKQPVEARPLMLKPDEKAVPGSAPASSGSQPESEVTKHPKQKRPPRSHSPGRPPIQPSFQSVRMPYMEPHRGWIPPQHPPGPYMDPHFMARQRTNIDSGIHDPQWMGPGPQTKPATKKKPQKQKPPKPTEPNMGKGNQNASMENLLDFNAKDISKDLTPAAESDETPETCDVPPNITSAEKRSELLKYSSVLTLDPKTAHKRIVLSEGFTKASVSDEPTNYPDSPERFSVCSQVLASKGFSRGRHYWEVKLSSNNFIGIGLAYSSIDRKGPTSRLGRNAQSWCVEWFNVKLSAWYNSSETVLVSGNPKRVGVLLDCEEGTATFYNVADRAYPFHSFVFPFAEAVYPAFWLFSSGSSASLCKLQA
uniref:E3 ubiquitin/ISG15 ligase TRIM25 isoform X2 n=1 Tax=Gasterosteus aculeatus aculeatus TaxID=481459 RepID=UPI001A99D107|nr:E3 ubiquitin/ISG15 ligase TRIM25 isoform X2 [Gasterosteus aculeatus aculeatus]